MDDVRYCTMAHAKGIFWALWITILRPSQTGMDLPSKMTMVVIKRLYVINICLKLQFAWF